MVDHFPLLEGSAWTLAIPLVVMRSPGVRVDCTYTLSCFGVRAFVSRCIGLAHCHGQKEVRIVNNNHGRSVPTRKVCMQKTK